MTWWRLVRAYIFWHYSAALGAWWQIYVNSLWFLFHFFSIPILFRTLFAPWRRLAESYPKGFSPKAVAETLLINFLMRLVGFIFRIFFIFAAWVVLIFAFVFGWLVLVFWLFTPPLAMALFGAGFYLTFLT